MTDFTELLEDAGLTVTHDAFKAIYIFPDGTMLSGCPGSYGIRSVDHRAIGSLWTDIDRYSPDFWPQVFDRTDAVMVCPENSQVTYPPTMQVTACQRAYIKALGYEYVPFE